MFKTKENKEVYICGDFNIDLLKVETLIKNATIYCVVMGSYHK